MERKKWPPKLNRYPESILHESGISTGPDVKRQCALELSFQEHLWRHKGSGETEIGNSSSENLYAFLNPLR